MSTEEDLKLRFGSGSLAGVRAIEVTASSCGSTGEHVLAASAADSSNSAAQQCLSYERYLRLSAAASVLLLSRPEIKNGGGAPTVLKLGTADGALARFLPGWKLHVLSDAKDASCSSGDPGDKNRQSPDTLPDQSFDVVVALGVLEGVNSAGRERLLQEMARLTRFLCVVDMPSRALVKAWPQILELTLDGEMQRSQFIGLPDSTSIGTLFRKAGFSHKSYLHTGLEAWLPYAALSGLNPVAGRMLGTYLMDQVCEPEASVPLAARQVYAVDDRGAADSGSAVETLAENNAAANYAFEIIAAHRP